MDGRSPKRIRLEWVGTILEAMPCEVDTDTDYDNSVHSSDPLTSKQRLSFDVDLTANLPDDILAKIFFGGYVNTMEVIQSVSCVSKQLQRVAHEAVKLLDLRACTPALKVENVASLVKRFKNVSELDFSYCQDLDTAYLNQLSPLSATLRTLRLRGALHVQCPTDPSVLTNLVELDLSAITSQGSTSMSLTDLIELCRHCQNVERLNLAWRKGFADATMLENMTRLKALDVSLTTLTAEGCRPLANMCNLVELDLSATDISHEGILRVFPPNKSSNIEELRLRFVEGITSKTLVYLEENAPKLKLLDITSSGIDQEDSKLAIRALQLKGITILI